MYAHIDAYVWRAHTERWGEEEEEEEEERKRERGFEDVVGSLYH